MRKVKKAFKAAADYLRKVHDSGEAEPVRRTIRKPRGICHCQHCHAIREG